ncbi:MAG: hypothetical protein ABSH22_18900 [Tepidisphaeraceae bacterium]|jgi:antitoxin component HigA of HigAB toxin-antitoxin module
MSDEAPMEMEPLKNDSDYRRVLREIETLMDSTAHSAAGDRLDRLVALAQAWEEKHHRIEAPAE